ncbi:MAG: DUF6492 family protein [Pseudonocardiaceae bacterium]
MSSLAVITPSFGPDAAIFQDLRGSVLEHTSPSTVHHVIVPRGDRSTFAPFACAQCVVRTEPELLPRRYVRMPVRGLWMNLRRPWPPARGWVLQQALKIAAAGSLRTTAVLIADSDVTLVRAIGPTDLVRDGQVMLYRLEGAVHAGMHRHVRWHQVARRLLGVEAPARPPLHDYVSSFNVWDPSVVRGMQARIGEVTGRRWLDAVTSELHVSEFVLYGVYVDEVLGGREPSGYLGAGFCHNYWDDTPLDRAGAEAFAAGINPDALAVMISAKSRTPHDVRRWAEQRCRARLSSLGAG